MIHDILTFFVNLIIYLTILCIWIAIMFAVFRLKPNAYLPFGFLKIAFNNVIKPLSIIIWKGLKYISLALFKWLIFTLEQFWHFLVEVFQKLFQLLANPKEL